MKERIPAVYSYPGQDSRVPTAGVIPYAFPLIASRFS